MDVQEDPAIRFSVWAPNAQEVELVFGDSLNGYIDDQGNGVIHEPGKYRMFKDKDGIWHTDVAKSPDLADFRKFDHTPYMFKIKKDSGKIAYRTDIYSRCQIGSGKNNPDGNNYKGTRTDLDGTVSCSVVVDPERVTEYFSENVWPEQNWLSDADFWNDEFDPHKPVPKRIEDLVIYKLHVGGLGFGKPSQGDLKDAIDLLKYLAELGVNAIQLMPLSEFEGWAEWGYGTSHYCAVEYSGGGRDQFKHFIRQCHRNGIAVILDVVYNHYHHKAERAEWAYDSDQHEKNIYYWYEGATRDYPTADGGYINNDSTGYAPRFYEEMVRKMFISSAVALMQEFHVDGFRVDQTTSIHAYPSIKATGQLLESARLLGAKFLREWTRTMKLVNQDVMLIAEDHSTWDAVTKPTDQGGLGFDSKWYADFYHHLIGDTKKGIEYAKLLKTSSYGDNRPLAMGYFAGTLSYANQNTIVYHESHDEAGNSRWEDQPGVKQSSARTMMVAVNRSPLVGETRRYAEARSRVACSLVMLSAGIPMFFMGEEIAASKDYRYEDFLDHKEDLYGEKSTAGKNMFLFYKDIIRLRQNHKALRSRNIDIIHVHDENRIISFRRRHENEDLIIVASLNNEPFLSGYSIDIPTLPNGKWKETFNSDGSTYGGNNVGNGSRVVYLDGGQLNVVIPANGVVMFHRL